MKYLVILVVLFCGCNSSEGALEYRRIGVEEERVKVEVEEIRQKAKTERTKARIEVWERLPFLKDKEDAIQKTEGED